MQDGWYVIRSASLRGGSRSAGLIVGEIGTTIPSLKSARDVDTLT